MVSIHKLEIGQTISAIKYGKNVEGEIIKKLAGAVVINNAKTEKTEVVDVDRITKII